MGSPGTGFGGAPSWPRDNDRLYPALPLDDFPSVPPARYIADNDAQDDYMQADADAEGDVSIPGTLTFSSLTPPPRAPVPLPSTPSISNAHLAIPGTKVEPFVFGSPLPQHNVSNTQFRSAAASVLEEMNKRLRDEGIEGVGMDLVMKLDPKGSKKTLEERPVKGLPGSKGDSGVKAKFERMHEQEFSKMESIAGLVKRREGAVAAGSGLGKKRKSSALGRDGRDGKRRISVVGAERRISGTRVISNARRAVPGAFGVEDDADEDSEDEDARGGKRVRVEDDEKEESEEVKAEGERAKEEEEQRKLKEREAIRRKLEMNKARRRSSAAAGGRVSVGGRGRVSGAGREFPSALSLPQLIICAVKPKPKPSRFGFLSSAKIIVQNVWNRGKSTASTTTAAAASKATSSSIPVTVKPSAPAKVVAPPTGKKISITSAPSRPSSSSITATARVPSLRVKDKDATPAGTTSLSRSRSPLPSFTGTGLAPPSSSSRNSRGGSMLSITASSSGSGVKAGSNSSLTGVSSIGTRTSSRPSSTVRSSHSGGEVGSMGAKKVFGSVEGKRISTSSSASSRLLAPTASSLAKMSRSSSSGVGLAAVAEDRKGKGKGKAASVTAISSPVVGDKTTAQPTVFSPRPGGIFSRPLVVPAGTGIPSPVKNRILPPPSGAGDTTMDSNTSQIQPSSRPRTLAGRKPRISRSKVIAKLASQRAAGTGSGVVSASGSSSGGVGAIGVGGGRTRSSLGAKVQRQSFAGGRAGVGPGSAGNVLMSAKKRARQSEYARRRSRIGALDLGAGMDVDG